MGNVVEPIFHGSPIFPIMMDESGNTTRDHYFAHMRKS